MTQHGCQGLSRGKFTGRLTSVLLRRIAVPSCVTTVVFVVSRRKSVVFLLSADKTIFWGFNAR